MTDADRKWVSRSMFNDKGLVDDIKLWWHPPEPPRLSASIPDPNRYFVRKVFLWMPQKMWGLRLRCVNCDGKKDLTSKGVYNRVREVIDIDCRYYLVTQYLECPACKKTYLSYSKDILKQLDPGHRLQFPAILSHKLACDIRVITLLRSRTLGNSSSALHNNLDEIHAETWLRRVLLYLTDCKKHQDNQACGIFSNLQQPAVYQPPPDYIKVPSYQWILGIYSKDVHARVDDMKAQVTSVYGRVLKMDSTKKVCENLCFIFVLRTTTL